MVTVKRHSQITISEWICFHWIDITEMQDAEPKYLRGLPRPVDEAIELSEKYTKYFKAYDGALNPKILEKLDKEHHA